MFDHLNKDGFATDLFCEEALPLGAKTADLGYC